MRNLSKTFVLLILLLSCDDNMRIISRDFSVSLESIDGHSAIVGKEVNCVFSVNHLDKDNSDDLYTTFQGNGIIRIESREYESGKSFDYDYRNKNKIDLVFIPGEEGKQRFIMSVKSEVALRSDTIEFDVTTPKLDISFEDIEGNVPINQEKDFTLLLDTDQDEVKGTARFVKGGGKVLINGYTATGSTTVTLDPSNLIAFTPNVAGENIIEFTVSAKFGKPVKKTVTIEVIQP